MGYIEDGGGLERPSRARVVGGGVKITTADPSGGLPEPLVAIGSVRQDLHDGLAFSAGIFDSAVAIGADLDLMIQVGDNELHLGVTAQAGQNAQAQVFEGTTFSAAGTPVVVTNRNRTSSKGSLATITSAPTITLDGTLIGGGFIPGSVGPKPVAGQVESIAEWVLAPNTVYLVRLANDLVAAITPGTIALGWVEPGAA